MLLYWRKYFWHIKKNIFKNNFYGNQPKMLLRIWKSLSLYPRYCWSAIRFWHYLTVYSYTFTNTVFINIKKAVLNILLIQLESYYLLAFLFLCSLILKTTICFIWLHFDWSWYYHLVGRCVCWKDSRAFMGGLPRWEYIVHLLGNGFHFAAIAVFSD